MTEEETSRNNDAHYGGSRSAESKTVEIKLTIPAIPSKWTSRAKALLQKIQRNRSVILANRKIKNMTRRQVRISAFGILLSALAISYLSTQNKPQFQESTAAIGSTTPQLTKGTPDYPTVLPKGKDIEAYGGWTRVSPPEGNPVFAYTDSIGGTAISVSQQPLPDSFKNNTDDQVAKLAQEFNATERITLDTATVHLGSSAEGPQSAIFHMNKLLILIKSKQAIDNDGWAAYIDSLE